MRVPALRLTARNASNHRRMVTVSNHTSEKRCSKCGISYPANSSFFSRHRNGKLYQVCKFCQEEAAKATASAERKKRLAAQHKATRPAPKAVQANTPKGTIYFVRCIATGKIKIGFTGGVVEKRFNDIQCMSPVELELLGTIGGTVANERELHLKFGDFRSHGEWFHENVFLLKFIDENAAKPEKRPKRGKRNSGHAKRANA